MKLRMRIIIMSLCAVMVVAGSVGSVIAGDGPEPPPANAIILEDVAWGVVLIYCPTTGTNVAAIRVKKVDSQNCIVATDAVVDTTWDLGCPAEDILVGETISNTSFFNMPDGVSPYISKIKNYKKEGDVLSFDAQIKFWK